MAMGIDEALMLLVSKVVSKAIDKAGDVIIAAIRRINDGHGREAPKDRISGFIVQTEGISIDAIRRHIDYVFTKK